MRGFASRSALALAAVVAACSSPAPGSGATVTKQGLAAAANSVTRAEGLFFTNRYSDAESAYRDGLRRYPWYGDGHAAYALFLTYQHRFSEATGEAATARSLDPRSSYAAAVDTRVHDWAAQGSADLKSAAAIGADAIRLGPASALAHAFYSETLADTSDAAGAQRQADIAASLAKTPYEQSEVERERANLARDARDTAAELAHLKASQQLQPGWAERTRELAEYYFVNDQPDQAVTLVRQAVAMAPRDPALRLALGSEALLRQDVALADESFTAANDLKPHDPQVESTLAMTHFTLHHDAAEAERLLRAAAADAPGDATIAGLLSGFLRYIKGDPSAAEAVSVGPPPAEPLNPLAAFPVTLDETRHSEEQAALDALNAARARAHLSPVHLDDRVSSGAEAHAYWWLFNLSLPDVKGLGIHHEVPGTPGFTGVTMRDRATTFGYPQASMAEDITHRGDPAGAISDWVDSVYHRFPLMNPMLEAVGFGEATGGDLPIEVLDMGYLNELGDPRSMVAYPADGQTAVPTSFAGNELPDPVPPGGKYPTGYPVTLNFNTFSTVEVAVAQVRDATGAAVDSYLLPPTRAEENVLTLLPRTPLASGSVYRVHVTGTIDGSPFSHDWSFTTAS